MATRLEVSLKNGAQATAAERKNALRKLQIVLDGAVAPLTTLQPTDEGTLLRVDFPAGVAPEQPLACFRAAVNLAGLPESPFEAGSPRLEDTVSGADLREFQPYVYSV